LIGHLPPQHLPLDKLDKHTKRGQVSIPMTYN